MSPITFHVGNVTEEQLRKRLYRTQPDWAHPFPLFGEELLKQLKDYRQSPDLSEDEKVELDQRITNLTCLVSHKQFLWKDILHLEKQIAQLQQENIPAEVHDLEGLYAQKTEKFFNHPIHNRQLAFIERWKGNPVLASLNVLEKIINDEFISLHEIELILETIPLYIKQTKTMKKGNPLNEWLKSCFTIINGALTQGYIVRGKLKVKEAKVFRKQMYYKVFGHR
ncbi:MAG: hypothetical protein ACFFCQ_07160 [Promethearchaeota archaeon]